MLVSNEERKMLLERRATDEVERVVWSDSIRQAKLAFIKHENHGGSLPSDPDGSFWLTGSDLA